MITFATRCSLVTSWSLAGKRKIISSIVQTSIRCASEKFLMSSTIRSETQLLFADIQNWVGSLIKTIFQYGDSEPSERIFMNNSKPVAVCNQESRCALTVGQARQKFSRRNLFERGFSSAALQQCSTAIEFYRILTVRDACLTPN